MLSLGLGEFLGTWQKCVSEPNALANGLGLIDSHFKGNYTLKITKKYEGLLEYILLI